MTKLRAGLLIAAGIFLLIIGIVGTAFYFRIYKPVGAPLMAMSTARILEQRRLQNQSAFSEPGSGELSAEQVRRFVAVEQAVETTVAGGAAALAAQQTAIERAEFDGQLTVRATLAAFGEIRPILMNAKTVQIDAMNKEGFSKKEFEWVRSQLYLGAGLRLTRLDVSEILDGVPDPAARVRAVRDEPAPEANRALAQPLKPRLEQWRAFGFFGL